MHKEHVRGLIGITLVSAVAFGAAFSLQSVMKSPEEEYHGIALEGRTEPLSIQAANGMEGIQDIQKIVDGKGTLTGYVITVAEKGYGGEMLVDVAIDLEGMKLVGVHVGENNETGGIGSQVTEKKFLEQFKGMALPVYMEGMGSSTAQNNANAGIKQLKDGKYEAKAEKADDNGFVDQVKISVEGGKITSVIWDCLGEDGTSKRKLADEGQYVMTEDGLTWTEQANALAEAVIKGQSIAAIGMNEQGKTDTVAGVSIYVGGFAGLLEHCLTQADASVQTPIQDGTYVAKGEKADDNGFIEQLTMKVESGKITSVIWDCVNDEGVTKRKLADEGQYVMTEDGLTWTEQANALAEAVIKGQSVQSVGMNEQGKTDTVAGVSIYVGGFVSLAEDCLVQASGVSTPTEETPTQGTEVEAISGATISSKAVARAIDKAYACVQELK